MAEITRVNPLEGFCKVLEVMATGHNPHRNDVFNDRFDNVEIDTCVAMDTGKWETGICRDGGSWTIVAQYGDRDVAQQEHALWVERLRADPAQPLKDIDLWGLGL